MALREERGERARGAASSWGRARSSWRKSATGAEEERHRRGGMSDRLREGGRSSPGRRMIVSGDNGRRPEGRGRSAPKRGRRSGRAIAMVSAEERHEAGGSGPPGRPAWAIRSERIARVTRESANPPGSEGDGGRRRTREPAETIALVVATVARGDRDDGPPRVSGSDWGLPGYFDSPERRALKPFPCSWATRLPWCSGRRTGCSPSPRRRAGTRSPHSDNHLRRRA